MDVERHLSSRSGGGAEEDGEDEDDGDEEEEEGLIRREVARPRTPRLHMLPERTAPMGFLANVSLKYGARGYGPEDFLRGMGMGGGAGGANGVANGLYFRPGPYADLDLRRIIVEREQVPEILSSGLISFEDAKALFRM